MPVRKLRQASTGPFVVTPTSSQLLLSLPPPPPAEIQQQHQQEENNEERGRLYLKEIQETETKPEPVTTSPGLLHPLAATEAVAGSTPKTTAAASGATLVSPHPAPVSIRPGSSTSRQPGHLHISHSCTPELDHYSHLHAPDPDLPFRGDLVVGSNQPPSQPQSLNLELTTGSQKTEDQVKSSKMIFTDLYKSPKSPLSRLRHPHQPIIVPASGDYDADLISKDKSKQKEAVKRHLQAKVRNDWTFTWPQNPPQKLDVESKPQLSIATDEVANETQKSDHGAVDQKAFEEYETALDSGDEPESDSDVHSVYSTVSDDPLHWKPRLEWSSELSDDELPYNSPSPFKFDSPDSIGQAVTASKVARKARRRREIRKETAWNEGLACFEARRNAWTGAKVAQVRPKPSSPLSSASPRRGFFWRTHSRTLSSNGQTPISPTSPSPVSPSQSQHDVAPFSPVEGDSENTTPHDTLSPKTSRTDSHKASEPMLVETLLPVPPPLLPPANPMRASITPALYNSIYEKVVVNSLQPSCPINLSDMIRACVSGWKRDGEWPPRPAVPEPAAVVAVKRKKSSMSAIVSSNTAHMPAPGRKMSFSFLGGHGRANDGEHKTRRESAAGGEDGSGGSGTGPGKAIRRSLQKVLGIGHTMATAADGHIAVQDH